jgi:hypothetical protein
MKKLIKWILILLGIILVLLVATPIIFKDKIVSKIKEEANKNMNAKFDFGDFDLSLIKSFPNFSADIEKLSILNVPPFEGDTLIYASNIGLTIDLMSVINGGEIKILRVSLNDPVMNFLVNAEGIANWDIARPSAETGGGGEPSSFKASLNKYSITNGKIVYHDLTMPFLLKLNGVNHSGTGDFTQDLFVLSTKSEVAGVDLSYDGISYISGALAEIEADLDMDMKNMKFTFKDNKILLNELYLGFSGWVAMPDTNIDMELKFDAAKSDFKNFLSVVPAVYSPQFKDLKASGKMALDGFIKGRYNAGSMPGYGINLSIDNGMFRYPSLPSSVENVFVDLKINNPDGITDHTEINLARLHVEMNKDPFDAKLLLKNPVSDPDIDAFVKGKIDLSGIQKFVPLEKGTSLSGIITADLTAKGRMSSIEKKKYEEFNASGNFGITGLNYSAASLKAPLIIQTLQLAFNPQNVTLKSLVMKTGNTDLSANGSLENFMAYALKDATLKGTLNLNSTSVDMNEFMGTETAASGGSTDTTPLSVLEVPGNIDFTLTALVSSLRYQDLLLSNVKGKVFVKDKSIRMHDVFMQLMDGSMSLSGGYYSTDINKPAFDFTMNIKDFDIQKTSASFITVQKLAPIIKNCTGKFSSSMSVKGDLDKQMQPVVNSLSGSGKLSTGTIVVNSFPVFVKIADVLKMDSWKKVVIPPVSPSFKFVNGRVYVDPFELKVNDIKANVAGSNGFDQTIDYSMATQIPRSALGGQANSVLNNMVSAANAKGANVSLGDVIPVNITIGGTVNDPKIGTDISKSGAKVMDDLKAKAKEEFEKQKAEAEAKANAEAERLKKEATERAEAEKQKAMAEAERLKKETEAKAKAKADSLKKEAERKAKEELKNLFKK